MNKLLYTIVFAMLVICEGAQGMNLTEIDYSRERSANRLDWKNDEYMARLNWAEIADRTHPADISSSDMTRRYLEGDKTVDWGDILNDAIEGHPIAQYCIAEKCNGAAKLSYNGCKRNFQTAMAMFILISAQKGTYTEAQSYLKDRIPSLLPIDFGSERAISQFIEQFIQDIEGR
ncbi:MAG: hypothetical protein E7015_03160 [Alphaproteobacteria bacterium]|nr:hypothetical protein [Alphaproteobacteria bacterium]